MGAPSGSSFAARSYPPIGVTYYPYIFRSPEHLIAYTKSDVFKDLAAGYEKPSGSTSRGGMYQLRNARPHSVFAVDPWVLSM